MHCPQLGALQPSRWPHLPIFLPEFDKVRGLNVLAVHFFLFVADLLSGDISTSSGTSTGCKTHFQLQNACHNMIALGLCCFLPFVCFNSFSFLMGSACLFDIIIIYSCNGYEVGLTSITFVIFYFFLCRLKEARLYLMFLARTNSERLLKWSQTLFHGVVRQC